MQDYVEKFFKKYNYIDFKMCKTHSHQVFEILKIYYKLNFHVNNPKNKLTLRM